MDIFKHIILFSAFIWGTFGIVYFPGQSAPGSGSTSAGGNVPYPGGYFPSTGGSNFPTIVGNYPGNGGSLPTTGGSGIPITGNVPIPINGNVPIPGSTYPITGSGLPSTSGGLPTGTGSFPSQSIVPYPGNFYPYPGSPFPLPGGNIQNQVFPAMCGSQLEVFQGISYSVTSPGYPSSSQAWVLCRWSFFTRDTTRRLSITCNDFNMPTASDCRSGAFLAVDPGSTNYQWYCGNNGPQSLSSTGNTLEAFFWSSWMTSASRGFSCLVSLSSSSTIPISRSCRCGQRGTNNTRSSSGLENTRVVGGQDALLHEFPWQALVVLPENRFCGGVLINERFVLTAAHCVLPPVLPTNSLPEVILGEHDRTRSDETTSTKVVPVSRVISHERYNDSVSNDNDIALIEFVSSIDLVSLYPDIAPACPPDPLSTYDQVDVTVAGWGYLSFPNNPALPAVLQKVDIKTVPISECASQYKQGKVTSNMICAGAPGKDACFSDSGGPLMAQQNTHWVIVGIVSFGPQACAQGNFSGVYTKVGNYLPWIMEKIGNTRTCPA